MLALFGNLCNALLFRYSLNTAKKKNTNISTEYTGKIYNASLETSYHLRDIGKLTDDIWPETALISLFDERPFLVPEQLKVKQPRA